MDLSKIPTEDLIALQGGDLTKVSTRTLQMLRGDEGTPPDRSFGEAAKDLGASAIVGVGGIAALPGQLYGMATGDVDNISTRAGAKIRDFGEGLKSEELKFKQAELRAQAAEAAKNGVLDEFLTMAKGTITDPVLLTSLIAEFAPSLGYAGLATKGTQAVAKALIPTLARETGEKALQKVGVGAAVGAGATLEGGGAFEDTYKEAIKLLAQKGVTGAQAEEIALGEARKAAGITTALTGAVGFLPGTTGLERILAGGKGIGALKAGAGEFAQGVAEGVTTTVPSNMALQNIDPTLDTFRGTGSAAALEAVGGGVAGGALGLLSKEPAEGASPVAGQPTEAERRKQNKLAVEQAERDKAAADAAELESRMAAKRAEREQTQTQKAEQKAQLEQTLGAISETSDANTLLAQRNELSRESTPQAKQTVAAINRRLKAIVEEKVKSPAQAGTVLQEQPALTTRQTEREEKKAAASAFAQTDPQQMEIRETIGLPERPTQPIDDGIAEPTRRSAKSAKQMALPFDAPKRPVDLYREALGAPSKFASGLDANEPVSLADIARAVKVDLDARPGRVNVLFGKANLPKLMDTFVGKTPTEIAAMEQPKGLPLSDIIYGELTKSARAPKPAVSTEMSNANPEPAVEPPVSDQQQAPLFGADGGDVLPDSVQPGDNRQISEQPAPGSMGSSVRDTGDVDGGEIVQPGALTPTEPTRVQRKPARAAAQKEPAPQPEPVREPTPAVTKEDPATLWDEGFDVRGMPFSSLPAEQKDLWVEAVDAGVATDARYNEIVDRVKRNERAAKRKPTEVATDEAVDDDPDAFLYRKQGGAAPKGVPASVVQRIADSFKDNAKNSPAIKVVQSTNEVPQEVRDFAGESVRDVRGFYTPATNEVYVIADNTPDSRDAQITLMHELVGHYGLRSILGKNYSLVMKSAKSNALVSKMLDGRAPTDVNVEEVLAELSEGFVDGTAPKPARPLIQRIIEAVRGALRSLGMNLTLTDNEVAGLVADSYAYVFEGKGRDRRAETGQGVLTRKEPSQGPDFEEDVGKVEDATGRTEPYYPQEKSVLAEAKEFWKTNSKLDVVRNALVYQGSSVARKMSQLYSRGLTDVLGNRNPMGLYNQAQDAPKLIQNMLEEGGVAYNADMGLYETVKVPLQNPTSSLKAGTEVTATMVLDKIKEMVDTYKANPKSTELLVDSTLKGLHIKALMAKNDEISKSADAFEADGKKRDANKLREKLIKFTESERNLVPLAEQNIQTYDEIRQIQDIMNAVRMHAIDQAVTAGLISEATGKDWSANLEYVPLDRIVSEEEQGQQKRKMTSRGLTSFSKLPTLKGSEFRDVGNIVNNYFNMLGWMTSQTLRNDAATRILEDMRLADFATKISDPGAADNSASVVRVFDKGENAYYELLDPVDFDAFASLPVASGGVMRTLQAATRVLRTTVTAMPPFAISQVVQDAQRAAINSGTKRPFLVMARTLKNFPTFLIYDALGKNHAMVKALGSIGVRGAYDINVVNPTEEARIAAGLEKQPTWKKVLGALDKITTTSDLAARAAVYQTILEESGQDKSRASVAARELINFRRRGSSAAISFGIAAIPFFNAYIQGMDVLYRSIAGTDAPSGLEKSAARAKFFKSMAGALAIGSVYALLMAGDDEYEDTEDFIKDRAWVMPGGIKIPMPPELGVVFKVLPERVVGYYRREGTEEEKQILTAVREYVAGSVFNAYATPNATPQLARPILEWVTNYSFFTGRDIVPSTLEAREPFRQFGANTSEPARIIGESLNISPMKVDNLLTGVFGMLGSMALQVGDAMLTDRGDRPLYKMPLLSTFSYDPVGSKPRTEFYNLAEKINRVKTTYDDLAKTDPEAAVAYLEKKNHMDLYSAAGWRDARLEQVSRLRAMRTFIQEDKTMTGAEKRVQLDALRKIENELNADVKTMASYLRAN